MAKIYLIRHAESEANASNDNLIGGHNLQTKLTKKGELQATDLGNRLKDENVTFDMVYISTAMRTRDTANIVSNLTNYNGEIIEIEEVLEQDHGDFVGQNRNSIYHERKDVRKKLDENNWEFIPGDVKKGESQKMVAERMNSFVNSIAKTNQYENIAVFSHGLAIKFLLAVLLDSPRNTAYKFPIDNASITCLEFIGGELVLPIEQINDINHLE